MGARLPLPAALMSPLTKGEIMKIHADNLTAQDIRSMTPPSIYADVQAFFSRKRARGFTVYLEYLGDHHGPGSGRHASGRGGFGYASERAIAATYGEHGVWMARLFAIDPSAIIAEYDGRDEFARQTAHAREHKYPRGADYPWLTAQDTLTDADTLAGYDGDAVLAPVRARGRARQEAADLAAARKRVRELEARRVERTPSKGKAPRA